MRVLLVNDRRPGAGSGVEVHLGLLADALDAAGDAVELFAGEIAHRGVAKVRDVWDPRARRALAARAARFRPDVVHHHNVVRELSASVLGVPPDAACVLSIHDVRLLTGAEGVPPPVAALPVTLAKRAKGVLDRRVARANVDVVIAHSQAAADGARRLGLPVHELAPFSAGPAEGDLAPPSAGAEILFAGRLSPEKGAGVLLDAFARASATRPQARLVIAGDGPERAGLQLRAASVAGIEFTGVLDRDALQARLAKARAVVVPSLGAEGGPLAVVEAALAGRPTIVSDVPGVAELVSRYGNGIVVAPGDVDALAAAVGSLLDDPEAADRMGAAGRAASVTRNSSAAVVPHVHAAYEDAIRRRRGRDSGGS